MQSLNDRTIGANPDKGRNAAAFHSMTVLGSRVHLVQNDQVLSVMERWINGNDKTCHFIVNTGFHGLEIARRDPKFRDIVNSADLFSPDGIATVIIAKLRGEPLKNRATSAELMAMFFRRAQEKRYRSFFYGDTEETLAALQAKVGADFPGHIVAGTLSPPFRPLTVEEDEEIIRAINSAKPDVLWVGLGLPKQELWIWEHKSRLEVPVAIGVGACFGFFSGRVRRAPYWVGRLGLEWLWRFAHEPKKLWRRVLSDGPRFIWHVLLEEMRLKRKS